jgi:hypothetical protein
VGRKTALPAHPRTASPTASKPAHVQASLEMARPRLELGTPRFSRTRKPAGKNHKSPANRRVADLASSAAIPVVSRDCLRVTDVAGRPRPFRGWCSGTRPWPPGVGVVCAPHGSQERATLGALSAHSPAGHLAEWRDPWPSHAQPAQVAHPCSCARAPRAAGSPTGVRCPCALHLHRHARPMACLGRDVCVPTALATCMPR